MSKYIIYFIFLIACLGYGQTTYVYYPPNVDKPLTQQEIIQLEEVFGPDAKFVMDKPSLLKDLKDLLRNRIRVQEIPSDKAKGSSVYRDAVDLTSVPLYSIFEPGIKRDFTYAKKNFNILKYKIGFFPTKKTVYKLGDFYISVLPQVKQKR